MGIKAKGTSGTGKDIKPNYDEMYVVLRGSGNNDNPDDLKIYCLFAESGTDNPVTPTALGFDTRVSLLSEMFG